jgi:hypothetical protein
MPGFLLLLLKEKERKKKERERGRFVFSLQLLYSNTFLFSFFFSFLPSKSGINVKSPALTNKQGLNCKDAIHFKRPDLSHDPKQNLAYLGVHGPPATNSSQMSELTEVGPWPSQTQPESDCQVWVDPDRLEGDDRDPEHHVSTVALLHFTMSLTRTIF